MRSTRRCCSSSCERQHGKTRVVDHWQNVYAVGMVIPSGPGNHVERIRLILDRLAASFRRRRRPGPARPALAEYQGVLK